ncbi:MAG: hypothetical protein R2811_07060 [Flavobacteriales bacterium]
MKERFEWSTAGVISHNGGSRGKVLDDNTLHGLQGDRILDKELLSECGDHE